MFFKKKKKQGEAADAQEGGDKARRRYYRRAPGRKHALSVQVSRKGVLLGSAEVVDLSIGGVRLSFHKSSVPRLAEGEVIDLRFDSLTHPGSVQVHARTLRAAPQEDGSEQLSLEFTDVEALYPQLDAFFWNFFNRRRVVRVRPALDRRLPLSLRAGATSIEVAINDVSLRGLGFILESSRAEGLLAAASYDVSFPVPGSEERFSCRAERRHATSRGKNVLFGLEFASLETPGESLPLQRYVDQRESEQARWE
jgi:c-di-GMP-binding flagellar brake protein YcgR